MKNFTIMEYFYLLLLSLAVFGLVLDWEIGITGSTKDVTLGLMGTGQGGCLATWCHTLSARINNFTLSKMHIHWYFHFWVAWATFLLSITLAFYFHFLFKKTNLPAFSPLPKAFLLYALGVIVMGFHDSYCKTCSDLGICGSAHNYPNIIALLVLFVAYICYFLYEDRVRDSVKQEALRFLLYLNIIVTFLMIIIIFVGLFFMKLPSDLYYRKLLNWQGLVFVSIGLYALLIAKEAWSISHAKLKYVFSSCFFIVALLQIFLAYHIFTCYWCYVEECSEFFCIGGLFIYLSLYFFWKSVFAIVEDF